MGNIIKEKLIFSNNMNETELLRTISKNGHNTFGVRVLNDVEICSYILIHNGEMIDGKFINDKEQSYIYLKILGGKLPDAVNIKNAINSFRDCIIIDSLCSMNNILSDNYSIKKNTITNAYKKYIEYKHSNNLYDKYDMIEYIINNKLEVSNVNLEYFSEFNITKVFKEMLNNVFDNVNEISIYSYLDNNKQNKIDFVRAYGKSNEIESIFNKIIEDNIPLDNCQIVLTNSRDIIEILPYLFKYNIPYTTGVGVPFVETKPAKLLKVLLDLKKQNYGVDGYKVLFKSNVFNTDIYKDIFNANGKLDVIRFNEFIKFAGWLRIGFDNIVNINNDLYDDNTFKALNILNDDMKLGIVSFIKKYVIDDINNQSIIYKMEELINAKTTYGLNITDDELLTELFSSYVNKQISNSGTIHITNIDNAFSSLRKYTFVIGLDEDFPGNPKENYLIFDDEYKKTGSLIYISKNIVERKIERTKKLIKSSENAILSYSYYGLFDLKEKNPSSIIYDLLSESKDYELVTFLSGEDNNHKPFDFLSSKLNENKNIINARINNNEAIVNNKNYTIFYDSNYLLNKKYSPSSISSFFDNKFSFVLSNFFGIKLDDPDNPYDIIQANTLGTLIHELMEGFEKSKITEKEFMDKALIAINEFFEMRPPIISESKNKEIQDYKNTITNLYNMEDKDSTCIEFEKEIDDVSILGIRFRGKFDRIEKNNKGEYILVDYKTGKTIKHENNDLTTCIQGLIYAYMIEHTNNPYITSKNIGRISKIEFRYPYFNEVISIEYTKENEKEMINRIEEFKEAIINHDFICTPDDIGKYDKKYLKLLSLYKGVLS